MKTVYPKSPKLIDDSLLKLSGDFKIQIIKVILAICFFVLLYLFLIILAIGLLVISFHAAIWIIQLKVGFVSLAAGAGLITFAVMIFLFLIKSLFARYKNTNPFRLQITKKEHPLLFDLIERLSTDVKTKFPKKIFLVPDVNAAVFYNSSFWSMFLPIRKNLEIGLGLVNSLNISEFKSVIAHEFGHFSQKSTRLGSYVYTANKVIYNLVYDYDNWDKMLLSWSQIEGLFGSFASITSWLVEVIRNILSKAYDIINLMYLGLSREMEFQADLVACSVSGKEAMISALRKIEFSFMAYDQTISFLSKFIETNSRSENIFENHRSIIQKLSKDFGLELIEDLPRITDQDLERNTVKSRVNFKDQWASHPSREEREKNLRKIQFQIELKNDSAWHLFEGKQDLQRKVTNIFYDKGYPHKNESRLMSNNDFLDYVDKEDQKYHISEIFSDFYVSHYAANLEVDKVIEEYNHGKYRNIKHSQIYSKENKQKIERRIFNNNDLELLKLIKEGKIKANYFEFDNHKYDSKQIDEIIVKLNKEIEGQRQRLDDLDKKAFIYNYNLAAKIGEECKKQYLSLFSNMQNLGKKIKSYNEYNVKINDFLNQLYSKPTWKQNEFEQFVNELANLEQSFKEMIRNDESMNLAQEFSSDTIKTLFKEYSEDTRYYLIMPDLQEENFLKFYDLVAECFEALNAKYFTALKILTDFQSEVIEKSRILGSNLYS